MPAKSKQQYRFFKAMEAHPDEAKKKGIKPELAREYTEGMTSTRFNELKEKLKKKKS